VTPPRVIIVGGGLSGLATLVELRRLGLDALVLDQGPEPGNSWARRYDNLRLNSVRWLSHMPGLRMPSTWGRWPSRDNMVTYTRAYAGPVYDALRYGVTVRRVVADRGRWRVEADDEQWQADHVVVATGLYRHPVRPCWPGQATSRVRLLHAVDYRRPVDHEGERVVVVGPGVSGVDICSDLLRRTTGTVVLSVRTPPNLLPRELLGVPLQPLSVTNRYSPVLAQDLGGRIVQRIGCGDLSKTPLGVSPEGMFSRLRRTGVNPAVDDGHFLPAVRAGRVEVVDEVVDLAPEGVRTRRGTCVAADTVITTTGYRSGLCELAPGVGAVAADGTPVQYGAANQALAGRGLHLVGFSSPLTGHLREMRIVAGRTAARIARHH